MNAILFKSYFLRNISIHFYELNDDFKFKKEFIFRIDSQRSCFFSKEYFKRVFNIMDKNNYIYANGDKLYIISSKYLECVSIVCLMNCPDTIFILNNLNQILIKSKGFIGVYIFTDNELQKIDEHNCPKIDIYDIVEINEKGDYLLVTKIGKNHCRKTKFDIVENGQYSENKQFIFDKKLNKYNDYSDSVYIEDTVSDDDDHLKYKNDSENKSNFKYEIDSEYENEEYEIDSEYENDYISLSKKKKGKYKKKKNFKNSKNKKEKNRK